MRKCISRKMEHHHILSFLFVRGLTSILLVSGLGVEDQLCDLPLIHILIRVIYFGGLRQKDLTPIESKIAE
jgi:hypothetical protein